MSKTEDSLAATLEHMRAARQNALATLKRLEEVRDNAKATGSARDLATLNRAIRGAKKFVKASEGL